MIYTTLNKIRAHRPCGIEPNKDGSIYGLRKLMAHLGKTKTDDEPVSFTTILESNGLDDALWCMRSVPEESSRWRKLAVSFARTVQHLMEDPRSIAALDVAQAHAEGRATDAELDAARDAWQAASDAALGEWDAADAALDAAVEAGAAVVTAEYDLSKLFLACLDDEEAK